LSTDNTPINVQHEDFNLTIRQRKALKLLNDQNLQEKSIKGDDFDDEGRIKEMTDLSQTLDAFKEQTRIQDLQHYEDRPIPWYNLLTFPSRALWRSSPKPPPKYLTNAQFDIIQRSEKTPKQLRRTIQKIIKNQSMLSEKRERERRFMVNKKKFAPTSLLAKKLKAQDSMVKPVYYKPEQSLSSLKFRLVPNYSITKRVLRETQSLIGKETFQPRKVLDVGVGVGSSSAAILDLAFERCNLNEDEYGYGGVEWVHGIDPSQSMRDGAKLVLSSVLEGHQSDDSLSDGDMAPKRTQSNTRITFGENLTGTANRDISQSKGTFDLALCTYTLCEIPNLPSSLALAAIIWEKLSPNGVAVFIEPGTPDGFNSLRSVRNMLLDCCPPRPRDEEDFDDDGVGDEECHVIAPCTHNGECPMVRHKKNFLKNNDWEKSDKIENSNNKSILDDWSEEGDDDEEEEEEDIFDLDSDSDSDDEDFGEDFGEDFDEDDAGWEDDDEDEFEEITIQAPTKSKSKSSLQETDVFNSSFCSFIHGMPGGEGGKRGEKFSYLVVQKRISGETTKPSVESDDPFSKTDVVKLLLQSMESRKTISQAKESQEGKEILEKAVELENKFVRSEQDILGLELVKGRTHSWGRIVRAPIKKKGHVIVDYCTSSRIEDEESGDIKDQGKIIRQKISRRPIERAAPGTFAAARKSRWGGLWPDMTQDE